MDERPKRAQSEQVRELGVTPNPDEILSVGVTGDGVRWTVQDGGQWYAVGHWAEVDGRAECVGLELWKGCRPSGESSRFLRLAPDVEPGGIGGTDLRQLPVASIIRALWAEQREAEVRQHDTLAGLVEIGADADLLAPVLEELTAFAKGGRGGHFLQEVATVYREAVANREAPTKAVREAFNVSQSTATKWAKQARDAGLLPPTTPGKPSGLKKEG